MSSDHYDKNNNITVIIFVHIESSFFLPVQTSGDLQLLAEYNECVEKLKDFRSTHLQIVARLALLIK